jgi:hypothetical protein
MLEVCTVNGADEVLELCTENGGDVLGWIMHKLDMG